MAVSVVGGLHNVATFNLQTQIASSNNGSQTSGDHTFPVPASFNAVLNTVPGSSGSGLDSVTGPGHASFAVSGTTSTGTDAIVATQSSLTSGVTVKFTDGSSLTIAGTTNLHSFFHK